MFLFALEILLNTIVVDDFKYSFFFWLDIIATLSLIPDIVWLSDLFLLLIGATVSSESADAIPGKVRTSLITLKVVTKSTGRSKANKVIKSLRLIRLIRIIKLYKYVIKSGAEYDNKVEKASSEVKEDNKVRKFTFFKCSRATSICVSFLCSRCLRKRLTPASLAKRSVTRPLVVYS